MVAVFLGWVLAGEALTPQTMLAAASIVAVVSITTKQSRKSIPKLAEAVPGIVQAD